MSDYAKELRELAHRIFNPAPGHYAPAGGHDTVDLLEKVAKLLDTKPVTLSACCNAPIGYDAWVDNNGEVCGGPFNASCCMKCGGEKPHEAETPK